MRMDADSICTRVLGVVTAALAVLACSCTKNVSRLTVLPLSRGNPTSYAFDLSASEVHERAVAALRSLGAVDAVFGKRPARDPADPADDSIRFAYDFAVEQAGDPALTNGELFSHPGDRDDLYVHTQSDPLWPSPVYRGRDGGLPFIEGFHVHLEALGPGRTLVSVTAVDPQVVNGMKWGIGSCGPGYSWRTERVAPTTVEEYALLRFLGQAMRAQGMPELALPAPSTR
jgi:hypothetical protein